MPCPPRFSRSVLRRQAFTLLEILLVLALMGLLTSVLVVGVDSMLNPPPDSPTRAFWHAANAARRYSLQERTEVRLSFDKDNSQLLAVTLNGVSLPAIPAPAGTDLEFISGLVKPTAATNGTNRLVANLFGSVLGDGDTVLPYVTFYPDGTCSLFRVQIQTGVNSTFGASATATIQVDPWTCAPMLASTATGAGN
ncbi:MAG: prepilin-type N-terminal cleavage/methylation domain-containing protein [Verrucomicrobiota bacterium]